jgi:hypothetical protein
MSTTLSRSLTSEERALIWHLVSGFPDAETFIGQINDLRVVDECSCGCPSIDFAKDQSGTKHTPIANFIGVTPTGVEIGGMLWVRDNVLISLEVYCFGEHDGPFDLPILDTIRPFPKNSNVH